MRKVIILLKRALFAIHLAVVWEWIDNIKLEIEKKNLQLRARFENGNYSLLEKELLIFYGKSRPYQSLAEAGLGGPFSRDGRIRFETIKKNISLGSGTLLDIGANLGYFCHKFEGEGFDCYAVEENKMLCYFINQFRKKANKSFRVIPQSIFDYGGNQGLVFDVVLALSVFHHFLKNKNDYFRLINFLRRLEVKEFFFEPHLPHEFQGKKFYKNYTPEEFVNFIIQNSLLKNARLIGQSETRPIYKLTP